MLSSEHVLRTDCPRQGRRAIQETSAGQHQPYACYRAQTQANSWRETRGFALRKFPELLSECEGEEVDLASDKDIDWARRLMTTQMQNACVQRCYSLTSEMVIGHSVSCAASGHMDNVDSEMEQFLSFVLQQKKR
jgi:hypothetical protein